MCKTVKTMPDHWRLLWQQLLKHHFFAVSLTPTDADFQCEVNGHFFIQNGSETRTVGILLEFYDFLELIHFKMPELIAGQEFPKTL